MPLSFREQRFAAARWLAFAEFTHHGDDMRKTRVFKRPKLNQASYWRRRAENARKHAERASDRTSKTMMLGFAEGYEKMAKRIEKLVDA